MRNGHSFNSKQIVISGPKACRSRHFIEFNITCEVDCRERVERVSHALQGSEPVKLHLDFGGDVADLILYHMLVCEDSWEI